MLSCPQSPKSHRGNFLQTPYRNLHGGTDMNSDVTHLAIKEFFGDLFVECNPNCLSSVYYDWAL